MTSIIRFTTISGAHDESPLCYLLQVDEFRFLLDCGWDENFNMDTIRNIEKHCSQIDAVLISHPDLYHLGALPHLMGKCGLSCPIYATIPVHKMGQMFMYDLYQSHQEVEDFTLFSLDDVDMVFDKMIQLKYSQHVNLKGKGHGLSITPFSAGHMIGGTMWKIMKEGEDDIIYAVDYNHKKEIHLNGAVLETLSRPSLLITDSYTALNTQTRRKERDAQLLSSINSTLRKDGNVLLAVDTAGRVLELSQLLDQLWRESGLIAYSLALLNNVTFNVIEFAKSQVEWMSDRMMKMFEVGRTNPFQLKHMTLCHSMADLDKVPSPKVVLASTTGMNSGFSRDLFLNWSQSPNNSIIFTFVTSPGTLARTLIDGKGKDPLNIAVKKRVKLQGEELERHLENEREQLRLKKAQIKANEEKKRRLSSVQDNSDSDSDQETEFGQENEARSKYDLMLADNQNRGKSQFFKQAKAFAMFPFKEERTKWDDYGETIYPEDYAMEDDEPTPVVEATPTGDIEMPEDQVVPEDNAKAPTKCITERRTVNVSCQISYIDFEGRSDGESIKRILSLVKPRQLILIHGSAKSTKHLAEYCQSNTAMNVGKVFTPRIGDVVDATRESHIYQVKLKDSLVSSLKFAQTQFAELAWVDGQLLLSKKELEAEQENTIEGMDVIPTLEQAPEENIPGHNSVFIDEPRLSDFKQILTRAGIQAEFAGGVLVCNSVVAVRRNEAGKIELEGTVCDDYYTVRKLLYSQYAIV